MRTDRGILWALFDALIPTLRLLLMHHIPFVTLIELESVLEDLSYWLIAFVVDSLLLVVGEVAESIGAVVFNLEPVLRNFLLGL